MKDINKLREEACHPYRIGVLSVNNIVETVMEKFEEDGLEPPQMSQLLHGICVGTFGMVYALAPDIETAERLLNDSLKKGKHDAERYAKMRKEEQEDD